METRNLYFGSRMLKSGGAAATFSLAALIMVFSVAILVPEPSLGLERGERRRPSPEMIMERLNSRLKLSPEQRAAMEPIIAAEMRRSRELLDHYRAEKSVRRSELRLDLVEVEEDTSERLATVLSPEQLDTFKRLLEKRRTVLASRLAGRDGGGFRHHLDARPAGSENLTGAGHQPLSAGRP